MTKKSAALRAIREARYKDRVKELRRYFDGFAASDGFDLRDFDEWTGAQKAKVTRYWEVMGIQVARPHVVKRYKRPDHIRAAAEFAQQDRQLPGQRAVLIPADDKKTLKVKFRKDGTIQVKRRGVIVGKLFFNKKAFLADPISELRRVLEQSPAQLFKFMNGPHESRGVFNREELEQRFAQIIAEYGGDMYDSSDRRSHHWKNWLTGLIPYSVKDADKILKGDTRYNKLAQTARKARLRKKSADQYRLTKRALMTGRR